MEISWLLRFSWGLNLGLNLCQAGTLTTCAAQPALFALVTFWHRSQLYAQVTVILLFMLPPHCWDDSCAPLGPVTGCDRVPWTFLPWHILLMSAFWVARITGFHCSGWQSFSYCPQELTLHKFIYRMKELLVGKLQVASFNGKFWWYMNLPSDLL
jgi:hypothetical protein